MRKRLFIYIQQSIWDTTSGAAASTRAFASVFSQMGWEVISLSTTAVETVGMHELHAAYLRQLESCKSSTGDEILLEEEKSLEHHFICLGSTSRDSITEAYERKAISILQEFEPDVVLTFGDMEVERRIRAQARKRGCRVLYTLHNHAYANTTIKHVDQFIVPSEYLKQIYSSFDSVQVCYPPITEADIPLPNLDRPFVTFVSPDRSKGAMVLIKLIEMIGRFRKDIPVMIVQGRSSLNELISTCLENGVDISSFDNIFVSTATLTTSELLDFTRVSVMPSVIPESGGRIAIESMLSGIPTLVSNRGALPEMVPFEDLIVSLPDDLGLDTRSAISLDQARPWFEKIIQFYDDPELYRRSSERLRAFALNRYAQERTVSRLERMVESLSTCTA